MSYGTVQAEKVTTESGYSLGAGNASSFKNRLINPGMVIDQRNAGASVAVTGNTGAMAVDRFELTVYGSGTGRFSAQRSTDAPAGFINSLLLTVTTADASPSSAYAYGMGQSIEGLNVSDLGWGASGAKPIAISFWAKSSITGTFPVVLNSGDLNLAYGATYTINAANTWEYKTVFATGPTTGGTTAFPVNTSIGFNVKWGLGGGTGRTIAAGSWTGANAGSTQLNVTGCTQLIATNGATLQITGTQLEVGTVATSFDFRSFGTELALCQRYCLGIYANGVNSGRIGVGWYTTTTQSYVLVPTPVTMRDPANISVSYGAFSDYDLYSGGTPLAPTSIGFDRGSQIGISLAVGVASGGTVGGVAMLLFKTTTARITLSCEL